MNHRNLSVVFLYTTPAAVQSCANSLAFSVQKPKLKLIYDDTTENVNEQKQTYLYILAAGIILILAGFFMHISLITSAYHTIGKMVANPLVFGPAAVCAFIFMGNGRYWLINLACALIASLIIQYFVIGHGAGIYTILYRAAAFLIVVYFLNLLKTILAK